MQRATSTMTWQMLTTTWTSGGRLLLNGPEPCTLSTGLSCMLAGGDLCRPRSLTQPADHACSQLKIFCEPEAHVTVLPPDHAQLLRPPPAWSQAAASTCCTGWAVRPIGAVQTCCHPCVHELQHQSSVPCRKRQNGRVDLALLDRNNKAGWQLARKLICKRNILNRGRLSVGAALRHRYFWPEF